MNTKVQFTSKVKEIIKEKFKRDIKFSIHYYNVDTDNEKEVFGFEYTMNDSTKHMTYTVKLAHFNHNIHIQLTIGDTYNYYMPEEEFFNIIDETEHFRCLNILFPIQKEAKEDWYNVEELTNHCKLFVYLCASVRSDKVLKNINTNMTDDIPDRVSKNIFYEYLINHRSNFVHNYLKELTFKDYNHIVIDRDSIINRIEDSAAEILKLSHNLPLKDEHPIVFRNGDTLYILVYVEGSYKNELFCIDLRGNDIISCREVNGDIILRVKDTRLLNPLHDDVIQLKGYYLISHFAQRVKKNHLLQITRDPFKPMCKIYDRLIIEEEITLRDRKEIMINQA